MKRLLLVIITGFFVFGALHAMQSEGSPERVKGDVAESTGSPEIYAGLDEYTPLQLAEKKVDSANRHSVAMTIGSRDGNRKVANIEKRRVCRRLISAAEHLESAAVRSCESERTNVFNRVAAVIWHHMLKDIKQFSEIDPMDHAQLFDLHSHMHSILIRPKLDACASNLVKIMRMHKPWGETPDFFATYALAVRHIIVGDADGGGHCLEGGVALRESEGVARIVHNDTGLEENSYSHVWHGVRDGVSKTMFPLEISREGLIGNVLQIMNDRSCVLAREKIDHDLNQWSILGQPPHLAYPIEIIVNEDTRVVETAYPIFCYVVWDEFSDKIILAGICEKNVPVLRELQLPYDKVLDYACKLIVQFRESVSEEGAASSSSASSKNLNDPIKYCKHMYIVDLAPALKAENLTDVGRGIYVRFPKDVVDKRLKEFGHS